jgi:hypothetical protein
MIIAGDGNEKRERRGRWQVLEFKSGFSRFNQKEINPLRGGCSLRERGKDRPLPSG